MIMLEVKNLSAGYGKKIIFENLSFCLEAGSFTALCGKNGSGKSTLLNLISGIVPSGLSFEGDVLFEGESVFKMKRKDVAQKISLLLQEENPVWNMSVRQFVETGLYSFGEMPKNQCDKIVDAALSKIGIADFSDKKIFAISGGEFQKCRLARSFVQGSPLMLFDEPSDKLDYSFQQSFLRETKELDKTILFSIHDINTASIFAEDFLLFCDGKIIRGKRQEIFDEDVLSKAFGAGVKIFNHPLLNVPQLAF